MSTQVTPAHIWNYDDCNAVNTDAINIAKEYKPTGQFYTDANSLVHLYGIKKHPIFKEPKQEDDHRKEPTSLLIAKYRLDMNSMKVLFKVLDGCQHITTLKLQNNGLTISTFNKLVTYLSADSCPIVNLFIDWNPIYNEDFDTRNS
jgi:hypothetical protein